jgi:hypothetical protein
VSLAQFENPSYTIRKALPLRDEQLKRDPEVIKYSLGQWSMSKEVLLHLANKIVEVLPAPPSFLAISVQHWYSILYLLPSCQ